ncbi:MAG: PINc/VapC family ATPase [Methanoregulaceae archaeon]
MKIVPDTSVVIDGRITSLIKTGEYKGASIIIPEAVVAELEAQANQGREIGFSGLTELQSLCKLAESGEIEIRFVGVRPSLEQVKLASGGEIDSLIRSAAIEHGAQFITSDMVQAEVAKAKGLNVMYLKPQIGDFTPLAIDQFFDEHTIAVYLKERVSPVAKKGTISSMQLVKIREQPVNEYELRAMAQEILERAKRDPDGFIEIEKRGITVVQIGSLRIAIARRPFSDGMEITAVRPIADVKLENYNKSTVLKERLTGENRGLIIAGSPGSGKTTLAQSLATFLSDKGFVVKTMEAPRELQVPDNITQYTALDGSMENTADVLLLVRPDFVIFDELRKNEDFRIFSDMRLAGLGMVGVIHATGVRDAIQRFTGRVDFGLLHRVVSTIAFVKDGLVTHIYDVDFTFKVPDCMGSEGHARPVATITDQETGEREFEVFQYEGELIVMGANGTEKIPVPASSPAQPVSAPAPLRPNNVQKVTAALSKAPLYDMVGEAPVQESFEEEEEAVPGKGIEKDIQRELGRYTDSNVVVQMQSDTKAVVFIEDKDVPAAIGKGGKNVAAIVNRLGIGIDIRPKSELEKRDTGKEEELQLGGGVRIRLDKKQLTILSEDLSGKIVDVFAGKEYLFTATVNEKGEIHLAKNSSIAQEMLRRSNNNENIKLRPV